MRKEKEFYTSPEVEVLEIHSENLMVTTSTDPMTIPDWGTGFDFNF